MKASEIRTEGVNKVAKKSFEEALNRLEEITKELENGEPSLEDSLKKFDEGVKLADFCNQKLEEAQQKIDLLLNKNGKITSVPFADAGQTTEADE